MPELPLYTPGKWAAGTPQDLVAMREVAIDCWVLRMRRRGARLPARHVAEPMQVTLLCIDRYDEPDRFVIKVFHPGQFTDFSTELHGARLKAADRGCHRFLGDEWVQADGQHHLQTLVCTPTAERAHEILARMIAAEKRQPR